MKIETKVLLLYHLSLFLGFKAHKVSSRNSSFYNESANHNFKGNILNSTVFAKESEIDYKRLYKLRFDPMSLYRDSARNSEISQGMENKLNNEILESDIENNTESAQIRNDTLNNIKHEEKGIPINETSQGSNIMKPQKGRSTLSIIRDRLKNLFFGATATLIKGQASGKSLLNLFEVIQFDNIQCSASVNGIRYLNGTCYHHFECISLGGVPVGTCANGYGVCCVFKYGCGMATNQKVSYFESPKFPLAVKEPITCIFTVNLAQDVSQLRLDFLFFELRRPIEGSCIEDQFIISGQSSNFKVPVLCGINTGQHLYVDVENSAERKIFLSVFGRTEGGRAFNIRILQLRKENLAPKGCLQYYTEPHGHIKSFNYDEVGNVVESRTASYLNNLNYAICFQRASNKCLITYSNDWNGVEQSFQLENVDEEENSLVPQGQAGVTIYNCPDDFIVINAVRLCGEKLNDGRIIEDFTQNAPVTDFGNGPLILQVRTDGSVVGRGFKLIYYQESCI